MLVDLISALLILLIIDYGARKISNDEEINEENENKH
jgi:hypothetical protein